MPNEKLPRLLNLLSEQGLTRGTLTNQLDIEVRKGYFGSVFMLPMEHVIVKVFNERHDEELEVYKHLGNKSYLPRLLDYTSDYLVLEYIDGETVVELEAKGYDFGMGSFWTQLDAILEDLYASGISPIDMNKNNILLTKEGVVKLIDPGCYSIDAEPIKLVPIFLDSLYYESKVFADKYDDYRKRGFFTGD